MTDGTDDTRIADTVRAQNPCERTHQMHQYADHYQVGQGFYVEKCVNCGLTKGQVRALHNDGRGL